MLAFIYTPLLMASYADEYTDLKSKVSGLFHSFPLIHRNTDIPMDTSYTAMLNTDFHLSY